MRYCLYQNFAIIFISCLLNSAIASPPSCTTDPKLTTPASSAYHIDGGGWRLVRRVAPSNNAWHPATDSLLGTASYGAATIDETADSTFSKPFTADATTEFLFATGDAQKWLIATGAQIGGVFTNDYYSNSNRGFQLSSDGVRGLNAVVFGRDDMDMTGQMSQNMGAKVYDFSDQSGFTIVTKMKWTAKQTYENFFALKHADTNFYAAINRFQSNSYLYFGFVDSNGVGCGSPAVSGNHGISTSSNTWFLLKVVYTHATKTLCQYVDAVELCHTCPSNFVLPSTVTLENWLGGNSATNAAYSGEMAGFYIFNRPLTAEEQTIVADRIVVDAPDSVTSAKWYNREPMYNLEDPWISINDHMSSPNLMLYGENSFSDTHLDIITAHNGANVFIRTTYIYPEASFVFNPASTAEETFDGSRGDIQTSQSVPVTTDGDGWTVIFKVQYDSSAKNFDAVFDLNTNPTYLNSNQGGIYANIYPANTLRIIVRNAGSNTNICLLSSAAIFVPDISHAVIITYSTQFDTLSVKVGNNAEVTTSCAGFVSRTYTALSIGNAWYGDAYWNGKIFGLYFFDSLVESNRAQELLECAASTVETSPCEDGVSVSYWSIRKSICP